MKCLIAVKARERVKNSVSVNDIAYNFADYMDRVAKRRECFMLLSGDKPVAELRPIPRRKRLGELPDILESLPHLSEEEAASFAADLFEIWSPMRGHEELKTPWESYQVC